MKLKKCDSWFSKKIRLEDSDDNGYGYCISCGARVFWVYADCGHYISRDQKYMATRYSRKNTALQCKKCNQQRDGNLQGFEYGLIQKYGSGIIDELHREKRKTVKFSQLEIDIMAEEFKKEVKKLLKEKKL